MTVKATKAFSKQWEEATISQSTSEKVAKIIIFTEVTVVEKDCERT
jgi:hypothetical protein